MHANKDERQSALLKLLSEKPYGKQVDIVRALKKAGFPMTQSSISRDFHELGIVRVDGRYLAKEEALRLPPPSLFARFTSEVLPAGDSLIVVKTASGAAGAVAEEIDHLGLQGLVGTVAGDNTIFLATTGKKASNAIEKLLMSKI